MKSTNFNKKDLFFSLSGLFFIFLFLLNSYAIYQKSSSFEDILWFCNHMILFAGIALLYRSKEYLSIILTMSIPVQFFWVVDFFLELFGHGLGRSELFFQSPLLDIILDIFIHGALIPICFIAILYLGYSKKKIIEGLIYILFLTFITVLLTSPIQNINCTFGSCDVELTSYSFLDAFVILVLRICLFFFFSYLLSKAFSFLQSKYFLTVKNT